MENKLSWKPRLKEGTRKSAPNTETTRMAAMALDNMKKVEKRRNDGTLDQEYLEKITGKKRLEKKIEKKKPWNKCLLAIPVILVLSGLFLALSSRGHNISGIVCKNKSPLSRAEVTLCGGRSYEATADDQGKFSIEGVEPGRYKLTVAAEIDPAYADVDKTPLVINVTKDIEHLSIQTYSNMPNKPRKPGLN